MKLPVFILFSILSSSIIKNSQAQEYKNQFAVISDNDVYIAFKQDRYYTNGLLLNYRHALKQSGEAEKEQKNILEFELAQKIYTPYYGQAPDPSKHDRPFTGYSYAGFSYNRITANEQQIKYTVQAGATGKYAGGEKSQKAFHNLLGIYKIQGWEYQLKGEYSLNLNLDYKALLYRTANQKFDIQGSGGILIGNAFSGANAGAIIRYGKINPLFSSAESGSRISNNASDGEKTMAKELYLFIEPQINFVAYDATIQGGMFLQDKGPIVFKPKRLVYSQVLGLTFANKRWIANYSVIFRSNEVQSKAVPYYYGSATLTYLYN